MSAQLAAACQHDSWPDAIEWVVALICATIAFVVYWVLR